MNFKTEITDFDIHGKYILIVSREKSFKIYDIATVKE